ncbi:hotdog fold domain-containing protein [Aeromicrobium sp. UC242_57]|uniref:hotdog fold domain-containing protein n=1 Tax=Aeromicrobium sp. UC242_57 TaxID=3374624 RepID=UPI00379D71C6
MWVTLEHGIHSRLYKKVTALPQGKRLFSVLYGQKAPYFASIHMQVEEMKPHLGQIVIPKRRSVKNHIGTVHAIAACNGLEAAMGLLAEATCPSDMRWLPKGMDVQYLAKSTTALTCTAETTEADWAAGPDVPVKVKAVTTDGTVTVEGTIHLWVTPKGR